MGGRGFGWLLWLLWLLLLLLTFLLLLLLSYLLQKVTVAVLALFYLIFSLSIEFVIEYGGSDPSCWHLQLQDSVWY